MPPSGSSSAKARAAFAIVVDLVGGDDEDALRAPARAQRFEQMRGAQRVDGERLDRIGDGAAHERLRGEMQHDLRVGGGDRRGDRLGVAQVAEARIEVAADLGEVEQRRVARRARSAKPVDARAEPLEPQRRPARP